ncbi:MAG: hypothetical protein ACRCSU_02720 [Paracoccaceae bacterium]
MRTGAGIGFGLMACAGVAACAGAGLPDPDAMGVAEVTYEGVETRLLDGDLVGFVVQARGEGAPAAVEPYARCAAAQYTLIRGFGFARHVRTNVRNEGGVWIGDAVYTISPALPRGLQTIDAEVTVSDCAEQGIPTV